MHISSYLPGKREIERIMHFDEMASPYFHKGSSVGVVLLHGFTGTPANMRTVADRLTECGYTVTVPLLSGHGTSLRSMDKCTDDDWLRDAFEAFSSLVEMGCTDIFVMGLSMGGLLASIIASEMDCKGLVLFSTPFRMQPYLYKAKRISRLLPFYVKDNKNGENKDPIAQSYNGAPLRKLRDLDRLSIRARGVLYKVSCPMLIVQSIADKRIDALSMEIAKHGVSSKRVETLIMHNSPHAVTIGPERDEVARQAVAFVKSILKESEK